MEKEKARFEIGDVVCAFSPSTLGHLRELTVKKVWWFDDETQWVFNAEENKGVFIATRYYKKPGGSDEAVQAALKRVDELTAILPDEHKAELFHRLSFLMLRINEIAQYQGSMSIENIRKGGKYEEEIQKSRERISTILNGFRG